MSLQVAELHRPATVLRPHLPPGAVWPHPQFQGNPGGVSSDKTLVRGSCFCPQMEVTHAEAQHWLIVLCGVAALPTYP